MIGTTIVEALWKHCLLALMVSSVLVSASDGAPPSLEDNMCVMCHGNRDLWEGDTAHLLVTADHIAGDIHWQKGLLCHDCHGGNPESFELREAHAIEDGFRKIEGPADLPKFCGHCHSDKEYMQKKNPKAAVGHVEEFWNSVHGKYLKEHPQDTKAATCTSCHPLHQTRKPSDPESVVFPRNLTETCGNCHTNERTALFKGVHHAAGERDEHGGSTPLDCLKCHGNNVHGMLAVNDTRSPMFLDNQVAVCGDCHKEYLKTYEQSVHGEGLRKSGLVVTAVCADCHRGHDILYAADSRSSLHNSNVAQTCGKCHHYIEERLAKSVHGPGNSPEGKVAAGGRGTRKPSCVDCHQGHDEPETHAASVRSQSPVRCGNCHADLSLGYNMSVHGELTHLGHEAAAKCSDCHGAHSILAMDNPDSQLAPEHRVETCRKCHARAVVNFAKFDPHANHKNKDRYPTLYEVVSSTETVVYVLLAFFVLHALLWFTRSLIHVLRYGSPEELASEQYAIIRFEPLDRVTYAFAMVSFLGLIFTGLPLRYSSQSWSQELARALGGFSSTSVWHHFFGLTLLCACLLRACQGVGWMIKARQQGKSWKVIMFGPDSLVPNMRDAKDALGMIRWFFGQGPKSKFERWSYWEKFDFWAMFLAVGVYGLTGLMLWFPNLFCSFLSGESLNLAKVIHAETALFVVGLFFIIHVFNFHLRPEKFPVDLSILTGLVGERHLIQSRPDYVQRMQSEGKLDQIRVEAPSGSRLRVMKWIGLLTLVVGLALLAMIFLASVGK